MNLQVLVEVDGQQYPLNTELASTIDSIINSYIKQSITGKKVKIKLNKGKSVATQGSKGFWTDERKQEIELFIDSGMAQGRPRRDLIKELATRYNKSVGGIYQRYLRIKSEKKQYA